MRERYGPWLGLMTLGVALVLAGAFVLPSTPAQAAAPGAPASCSAAFVEGGVLVKWERPANDGGSPIWAYVIKIKGQSTPVDRLEHTQGRGNELDTRWYVWEHAAPAQAVFQVRAVNSDTYGAWCETPVGSSPSPSPTSSSPPSSTPTTEPTTSSPPPTTSSSPPSDDPRPFIAYGEGSFLQDELWPGAPIDQARTTAMRAFINSFDEQNGVPHPRLIGMGGNPWGMPFDVGTCTDPVWTLDAGGNLPSQWAALRTTGFHARADMQFTGTSDSPFVVVDRCSGFTVWAAGGRNLGGRVIDFTAAGAFAHNGNGLDRRNPLSIPGTPASERSRGVIPDSMVIRKDLMDWAIRNDSSLGHTLEIFWAETRTADGFSHPMVGDEGDNFGWGGEGWRLALPSSFSLAGCSSPEARVIAKTVQEYGVYIGDNSGSTSNLKVEQEATAGAVWGGRLQRDELAGCFTWNDMVVIQPGWQGPAR